MGYIWNLVREDIERLISLFHSLSETFREQKIDDELRKNSVESKKLLEALAEMVDNFETRYKVDDEEKQDEGGALDDEEKQYERSVLELKKHERIVLELWLEELQEAVFNTEDLVDKIHTEALRHKLDGQISEKMEDIRRCIESHVKEGGVLGLAEQTWLMNLRHQRLDFILRERYMHLDPNEKQRRSGPFEQPLERLRQPLDPADYNYFVDESEVFGMDCDKEEIIKLLLSDDANDKQLSVISIVGNGRIGKTTLARLVYNEQRVSHHFDRKAWVDVTHDFDSCYNDFDWVIESILKFLTSQYEDLREKYNNLHQLKRDQLRFELQNCLKGKRFLLVLDGKQNPSSEEWEALQSAFNFAANGSHIIVTTRNEVIAPMKYAVRSHRMEPLSEEKCWTIFAKFAFGDQNPTSDRQLEVIGKEIVQVCHGLPSSVRILGSILRFKLQQEEWEAILKRLKPSSDSREEDSRENVNVVPKFVLSEDLKRCLAYCSIFPPDYEFEMEKLVLLCMAEGFLNPIKSVKQAVEELNSFFQKSSRNESSFRMCRNNLAYVSRYCFRLEDNHPSQIPLNTRYLSLVGGKYENSVIFEAIDRAKLLRTFLPLDHESRPLCANELQNLLSKLQFLRVLSLSHYHITEIPDSIGNLEHLRYIDLSHTPIKRLPDSVCELCNLQSLILSNCHSLTELPENTSNLVNLLDLDVSGSGLSEMPKDMHKLRKLELLPCFVVGKKGDSALKELCYSPNNLRGTLRISKLQNVTYEAAPDNTAWGLGNLEELVLEWDENTADPENARKVLAGLRPSYSNLKRLTISFYCGPKFPEWFHGTWTFNMVFLRLSNCKSCSTLPPLGKLPYLRDLIIECMDAVEEVGPDFSAETSTRKNTEFKYLESLTFKEMSKWTKWVPLDVLPCLKQLCIRRCPKLRGNLPKLLPSVQRVEISESQELVTTEESLKDLRYRDRIVSISSDGIGSSSLIIEGKVTEKPREIEERGETKEETDVKIQTTSKINWSKHEQKESTEDHSQFPSSKEKSSLPLPQHAAECSLLVAPDEESFLPLAEDVVDTTVPAEDVVDTTVPAEDDVVDTTVPITQGNCFFNWHQVFWTLSRLIHRVCRPSATTQGTEESEADVLSDTWSSFESTKVSEISELMALPTPLHSLKIEGCDDLTFIPKSVIKNPSLQHLYIINCCSLESFPYKGMALKILYIRNCKKLYFPLANENIQLGKLEDLSVGTSCDSLTDLSLHLFPKLRSLSIWGCAKLQKLSMPQNSQIKLTSLEALEIRDCPNLESFPTGGLPTPNLKSIWFSDCKSLNELPDQLSTLECLKSMFINDCPELETLSKLVLPSKLSLLRITSCNKLIPRKEWGLHGLASLCQLEIEGECKNVESFPVEELLPSNLSSLRISGLSDLKILDNTGLKKLESLKTLEISCCDKLQSLPEDGFPTSLSYLCIKECPLLKPKLQNKNGEDWYKIAHISCIEIDEEVIS